MERVARGVVAIEFHGYHSVSYAPIAVTLESQHFAFDQVRAALARQAVVIVMRGSKTWRVAVPELSHQPNVFWAKNPQAASVSPNNCPGGFEAALNALA